MSSEKICECYVVENIKSFMLKIKNLKFKTHSHRWGVY